MVIWILGLSGSGKTTIGAKLAVALRANGRPTVVVDGDDMRKIFALDKSISNYQASQRRLNAERIVEICRWLDTQGVNVVCNILCIFNDILLRNRELYADYLQIELTTPMNVVEKRDVKGIYKAYKDGKMQNVVGKDIEYPEILNSDLRFNTASSLSPDAIVEEILAQVLHD